MGLLNTAGSHSIGMGKRRLPKVNLLQGPVPILQSMAKRFRAERQYDGHWNIGLNKREVSVLFTSKSEGLQSRVHRSILLQEVVQDPILFLVLVVTNMVWTWKAWKRKEDSQEMPFATSIVISLART